MAGPELAVGEQLDLSIGAVAHGGHCVARVGDNPDSQIVFVRHALPGERVRAVITELHPSYARADAVEIIRPSPDRVPPPCPHAGPARCGGCDWQHASGAAQRELKARVVREQFQRVAGLDVTALLREVEELPGGLLGWRTRTVYAVDAVGQLGLRRHRSHDVEPVDACPLGVAGVGDHPALRRTWPGYHEIAATQGSDGTTTLLGFRKPSRPAAGGRGPDVIDVLEGAARLHHHVGEHDFEVDAGRFLAGASGRGAGARRRDSLRIAAAAWGCRPRPVCRRGAVRGADRRGSGRSRPGRRRRRIAAGCGGCAEQPPLGQGAPGRGLARPGVGRDHYALASCRRGSGSGRTRPASGRCRLRRDSRDRRYRVTCGRLRIVRPRNIGSGRSGGRRRRLAADRAYAFDAFPMTHHVECVAISLPPERPRRLGA